MALGPIIWPHEPFYLDFFENFEKSNFSHYFPKIPKMSNVFLSMTTEFKNTFCGQISAKNIEK